MSSCQDSGVLWGENDVFWETQPWTVIWVYTLCSKCAGQKDKWENVHILVDVCVYLKK